MRILIVRLSAMGDIIHAMPAVAGLRAQFPDSRIDWAIEERWSPLLTSRAISDTSASISPEQPLVHFVHQVHMRRWRQHPFSSITREEMRALRSRLRDLNYDHVIDLQGAIRSALLTKVSGARVRAGAMHPRELPARWWYNVKARTPGRHVVDQAAEIVSAAVGRSLDPIQPPFPVSPEAEHWADELTGASSGSFAIVNPGAGWGAKCWPAERYGALVRTLGEHGIKVLVNAGPGEKNLAYEVVQGNEKSAQVVECSLLQLIAICRRAALFVGGDTGPSHLANALGTPAVAIFGPTDPARNGPYAGRYVVLRSPESKRDHSRRRQPEPGLLTITVEQVTEVALALLGVPA
ncbi:MAG TPA: lipopolysaccharide heptosyltransferase I [Terriglobales bacterium]|jgi:heptosyltransferase-1|nr:lipopolysaccharide heptosyltransferase I [Terriglobales bacterium]